MKSTGLKYKDGVIFALDTAIYNEGMEKVKDAKRIVQLSDEFVFTCADGNKDAKELLKML